MKPIVTCVADTRCLLGEGALWDDASQTLWWVDIKGRRVFRHDANGLASADMPEMVSALALTGAGGMLAAVPGAVVRLGDDLALGEQLFELAGEPAGNRTNDAKVDARGRWWVGTMDDAEAEASGALWCVDAAGATRAATGFRVPNGPAFDSQGAMYLADSARQIVYRFADGVPCDDRDAHVFARFGEAEGYPDGMTVDAEDHLWIAFWDGWCVRRLSPAGQVVAEIELPVQRPTCPVFGGERFDTLYVTSARVGLNAEALLHQPQAGGVFAVSDSGVTGRPANRFAA